MRKKTAILLASMLAVGGISTFTSVSHAAQALTENFNSGDVTDGGIWSTGAITNPSNVSFTEPVGGPLTVGISPAATGTNEGGIIQTTSSAYNFTQAPLLLTLNAPVVAGVQQSLAPKGGDTGIFAPNQSTTYLGVDVAGANEGTYNGATRLDTGNDKAYLALNSFNALQFSLEYNAPITNAPSAINYTFNRSTDEIPAPAPNIVVTSMFLYLDAADASNGNFWINAGATWENTTTGVFTTDLLEGTVQAQSDVGVVPFNHDPANGQLAYDYTNTANGYYGGAPTPPGGPAIANAIAAQFGGGVAVAAEVQDAANDTVAGDSVSFGQLTIAVPEPASFGLAALGAGLLLRRKQRKA